MHERRDDRRVRAALTALVLAASVTASCASDPDPRSAPTTTPTPTRASPSGVPSTSPAKPQPLWVIGASPLPLAPDGFGKRLPTPSVLRDRRLPTTDVLAPPPDGRFRSSSGPVTPAIRKRMGETYRAGCPVAVSSLRYVRVVFRGFDGRAHTGELVVHATAAPKVVRAFERLFDLRFPIEQMTLPTTADLRAKPTGDGNDTAAFVCRAARGQTRFSAHAYGKAIDVNPFHNPLVRDDLVLPELASAYRDRTWMRPGMLLAGSPAVRAFTREGFTWGGSFRRPKDYQHFSLTGD
jgi:hypothetical protein